MDKEHDVYLTAADVAKGYGIPEQDFIQGVARGDYPQADGEDMAGDPLWLFSSLIAFLDDREGGGSAADRRSGMVIVQGGR